MSALSRNSEYQHKVVVTYPFLLYTALFLILRTFYEEVHNQYLVIAPKMLSILFLFINEIDKKTYNYSTKNNPIHSERNYKLQLVEKIEIFIKRMRWKTIMHDAGCKENRNVEKYGLKTLHSPKQVKELSAFEKELIAVVKNIEFRNARSDFQTTLPEDIRLIHNSKKTMTFTDKTCNMYRLTKEEHNKLLRNAVTSKYKKTNTKIKDKTNKKGKEILKNKEALHRHDINEESNYFFTLKDHKENFQNNPTVRLINPAKNDIEKIHSSLIKQSKVNQWKNTQNVIEWFMSIEEKRKYKFIVFDIKDFYPSIKETLPIKAINFSQKLVHITNEDKVIIKHARKSLLYNNSEPWMKKDSGLFDVTMGAYDGAEVCELVGTILLYKLSLKYNKNKIGLYRDDGLAIFNAESNCLFTLKDHKENFQNNPTVRLINPAKNDIGKISKVILNKINSS